MGLKDLVWAIQEYTLKYILLLIFFTSTTWAADLKVLSWNVFMLPKPIKISWQNYRTKLISEQLSGTDYDVMFFMEAFTGSFHSAMRKKLKSQYPYDYYLKKKNLIYPVMGSGVFVMSKHPFKVLDRDYYQHCGRADCHASKGVLLIEMQLPNGKTAQFASTHLQSGKKYGATRMKQIHQVKAVLERHARAGIPQFFLGDLNIDRFHPEFQQGLTLLGMEHPSLGPGLKYHHCLFSRWWRSSP